LAQVKVYGLQSHLGSIKPQLSEVIHHCLVEVFKLPQDKRFQRFISPLSEDFIFPPDRSEKYTIIETLMFEGRSVETKKRLIGLLYKLLAASFGITARDLEIVMIETPKHNWGIRGLAGDELTLNYTVKV
jgi:phenylpyruvate tautomerase PptA (4-oxalocrotonate tautomerase family)